jgi:hypothetical protein
MSNYRNKLVPLLESGIYGICNNRNKSIYIGYSNNMLKAVSLQLEMIQKQVHPSFPHTTKVKNLQVSIIETCKGNLKLRQSYWVKQYTLQGYTVINTHRVLKLRSRIRVDKDYNVLVELVGANNKSRVVGTFVRVQDAETYCRVLEQMNFQLPNTTKDSGIK